MKMIVCGGRDYHLTSEDHYMLRNWIKHYGITEVVHGACRGVDLEAAEIARTLDVIVTPFPAEKYGPWPACGPIRNQAMADYCSPGDYCAVFPGNRGTADMARKAKYAGLIILRPLPQHL